MLSSLRSTCTCIIYIYVKYTCYYMYFVFYIVCFILPLCLADHYHGTYFFISLLSLLVYRYKVNEYCAYIHVHVSTRTDRLYLNFTLHFHLYWQVLYNSELIRNIQNELDDTVSDLRALLELASDGEDFTSEFSAKLGHKMLNL